MSEIDGGTILMCVNGHTYGYYENGVFTCTHGGWSCEAVLYEGDMIHWKMNHTPDLRKYEVLNKLPDNYKRNYDG